MIIFRIGALYSPLKFFCRSAFSCLPRQRHYTSYVCERRPLHQHERPAVYDLPAHPPDWHGLGQITNLMFARRVSGLKKRPLGPLFFAMSADALRFDAFFLTQPGIHQRDIRLIERARCLEQAQGIGICRSANAPDRAWRQTGHFDCSSTSTRVRVPTSNPASVASRALFADTCVASESAFTRLMLDWTP